MARSEPVAFRLHPVEDADIIAALSVYAEKTYGIKELLRLGIAAKTGFRKPVLTDGNIVYGTAEQVHKPLEWAPFPEERKAPPKDLTDTLLGNFEGDD